MTRGLVGTEFAFAGLAVGMFEGPEAPVREGIHRYQPYRGPGHLKLQECLRQGRAARCTYGHGGGSVSFTVIACPEYGVLQLSSFSTRPNDTRVLADVEIPSAAGVGKPAFDAAFDDWPLHDAIVRTMEFDWDASTLRLNVLVVHDAEVGAAPATIEWHGVAAFTVPTDAPWGLTHPARILEQRREGDRSFVVVLQSGDELRVTAASVACIALASPEDR